MANSSFSSDRRDFLTGKSIGRGIRESSHIQAPRTAPSSGPTVRVSQRAMACDFSAIMNAGVSTQGIDHAFDALRLVADLEAQMSVYRADSELSAINGTAAECPVHVETELFNLLVQAKNISYQTDHAFDPTAGPLVALWRACRAELRIPTQNEIDDCLQIVGIEHVHFDETDHLIHFDRGGVELNLGGIGKGHALDRVGETLRSGDLQNWLLHGGHSSLSASGDHNGLGGWPVGIGNPLFTGKRLGTLLLSDCSMATSGSNIQYFRHQGTKYGHILDPRNGWPIETVLSVTVLAPTAALADALSTAFYVMGVEKVAACCDNLSGVSAIVIPFPSGRQLEPTVFGVPEEKLFWDEDQIAN